MLLVAGLPYRIVHLPLAPLIFNASLIHLFINLFVYSFIICLFIWLFMYYFAHLFYLSTSSYHQSSWFAYIGISDNLLDIEDEPYEQGY